MSASFVYGSWREPEASSEVAPGSSVSNPAIAREVHVSHNTVKQALERIFRKLDIGSRAQLAAKVRLHR